MSVEQNVTGNIQPPNKDLEVLKQNFPNCFDKNGDFDFDKFKAQLSDKDVNFSKESYGMDWLGKSYARLLATDETTTLLKEDETHNQKEENRNSENLLIKGDNLEVLKHLSNAYYEKVKMIYIDPPYNTGGDGFVYADDRKFTIDELQELAGINEDRAQRILDFTQSKSNSHSAWLTFMYPRLYIAKQLLKEDGVIFISIDDNEVAQLRLLMDEIFGEENFISQLTLVNNIAGRSDNKDIAIAHEYIIMFQKTNEYISCGIDLSKKQLEEYKYNDKEGKYRIQGLRKRGSSSTRSDRPNMFYPVYFNKRSEIVSIKRNNDDDIEILPKLSDGNDGRWRWGKTTFKDKIDLIEVKLVKTRNEYDLFEKVYYESEDGQKTRKLKSFLLENKYTSDAATSEYKKLMPAKTFSSPKSMELIIDLVKNSTKTGDVILDFFSGSGTTAHSILKLNSQDDSSRKFILIQLPEVLDSKSNKTAYDFIKDKLIVETPTVFEITKERLIRASKRIQEENIDKPAKSTKIKCEGCGENGEHCQSCKGEYSVKIEASKKKDLSNQDLGFKVFETMPIWEDYNFEAEELDATQIQLFDESQLTEEDIKAILVTWKTYDGVALTQDLIEADLQGYKAYYSDGRLYLMDKGFKTENLKTLLEKVDSDTHFNPTTIIAFGYHFDSKNLREISENIKSYANKKSIDMDFITRY